MKSIGKSTMLWRFPECDLLESIQEFHDLDREIWEFIEIPSRGDKLKLWSEPDARC